MEKTGGQSEDKSPDRPSPAKKAKRNIAEDEAMPLAERMRPRSLEELIGHEDLIGENGVLRQLILTDRVPSMILWSGPGVVPCITTELTKDGENDIGQDHCQYYEIAI